MYSGLGPQAGLYGAIFAGFFAALFGGTPAQVTGPTGPMTVVTAASVAQFTGDPTLVFTTVFLAVRQKHSNGGFSNNNCFDKLSCAVPK